MTPPDDDPAVLAVLLDEPHLVKYLAAWPRIRRDEEGAPDHEHAAMIMGMAEAAVRLLWERCEALGLTRAEGKIHPSARSLVLARVRAAVGTPKPEKPERKKR